MEQLPELLLIDKPSGMSSFDVIRVLRRKTGVRKFGHAGTLDPLATGLMLIGVEKGTKALTLLTKLDKEYVAEVRFGEKRSTGDLEGEVIETAEAHGLTHDMIEAALTTLVGTQVYPVSAYSAIKKDGVPFYKRARAASRKGEVVTEVPMRSMTVYDAELLDVFTEAGFMVARVRFFVGSGTYIRSLGEALGEKLGVPSTLQALRRTRVGDYSVADARTLDSF
jgi:tRNA pseudouridine55 synthase